MSSISIRSGSEGPRHDPYHFEEITVTRPDGRSVTIHTGLAVWAEASGDGWPERANGPQEAYKLFERYAGIAPVAAEKALREKRDRRYRYHPCGQAHFKDASGYPGESFVVCGKCGDVIDSHFNRSAIE